MAPSDTAQLVALILNAAWMVRHYRRACLRRQRAAALAQLGRAVRRAFNESEDFEPLLAAICDGLRPHDEQPF